MLQSHKIHTPGRFSYLMLPLIFLLLALNLFLFIKRDDSYLYKEKGSYYGIYYPDHLPKIEEIKTLSKGKLQIVLFPSNQTEWTLFFDENFNKKHPFKVSGNKIILDLQKDIHSYTLFPEHIKGVPSSKLSFTIGYFPSETYLEKNQKSPDIYHLVNSSIPVGNFKNHSLSKFTESVEHFSKNEVEKALSILKREGIHKEMATIEKIEKITLFLLRQLDEKKGIPSSEMLAATPWEQFSHAFEGHSQMWCGNFAKVYSFFANLAGIPTRVVVLGGSFSNVLLSGHGFCESFVNETNEWAYVDLYAHKAYVKNNEGRLMNGADIFQANQIGTLSDLTAKYYDRGELVDRPYKFAEQELEAFYFSKDAELHFVYPARNESASLWDKGYRYVTQKMIIYSLKDLPVNNFKYYLKVSSLIALTFVCLLWVFLASIRKFSP